MGIQQLIGIFLVLYLRKVSAGYCDKESLSFSGLKKQGTRFYLSGEGFVPSCDTGYRLTKPDESIYCLNGAWNGHFPPCVVVSCSGPPPPIQNGRVKSYTGAHASGVEFQCDEFYFLPFQPNVQCFFGEWRGTRPSCQDSRCYIKNLSHKNGVVPDDRTLTVSGETLKIRCLDGFSPSGIRPLCSRGAWIEYGVSPCKENDCFIDGITNGALMEVEQRRVWKWDKFRSESKETFVKVNAGDARPPGHRLHITCNLRYSFRGTGSVNTTTTCKQGRWEPYPTCLRSWS